MLRSSAHLAVAAGATLLLGGASAAPPAVLASTQARPTPRSTRPRAMDRTAALVGPRGPAITTLAPGSRPGPAPPT
jgi:hypothetical protein